MKANYTTVPPQKTNSDCPVCGWKITYPHTFESVLGGGFGNPQNGDFEASRSTPYRETNLQSDVLVPAAQTLIWSIVTTLPAVVVSMIMRWDWNVPLFVGATTILVSWISSMKRAEVGTVKIETFSYVANEASGQRRAVREEPEVVHLEVVSKDDNHAAAMKIVDLPSSVDAYVFCEFCRDILAGKALARKNWVGEGKQFSRDNYDKLMLAMTDAGLICSVPGTGRHLTVGGKHAIRRLIRGG